MINISLKKEVMKCLREHIEKLKSEGINFRNRDKFMIDQDLGIVFRCDGTCYLYPNSEDIAEDHIRIKNYMYYHPENPPINEHTSDNQLRRLADEIILMYQANLSELVTLGNYR